MTNAEAAFSPQFIYDTAKRLSLAEGIPFAEAHLLCRFVLEFAGGPVKLRGRPAPKLDKKLVRSLVRAGWLERGGHEGTRSAHVASVINLSTSAWSAKVEMSPGALEANLVSASDEAIDLVARHTPEVPEAEGVNTERLHPVGQQDQTDPASPATSREAEPREGGANLQSSPLAAAGGEAAGVSSGVPRPENLLLRPENEQDYLAGWQPITVTMSAFDESGFPNLDLRHVLDELVRELCDLDDHTLLERPSPGTVAITTEIHECRAAYCQAVARFDMLVETKDGRQGWANLCPHHAREKGLTALGMGRAQYLLHPDELDTPSVHAVTKAFGIPLENLLGVFGDYEPEWSKTYRRFGFVRAHHGRLVRRGVKTTVWAEIADPASGTIGIKVRKVGSFTFDDRGWDAVHPISWSEDLVREVLFRALKDESDLPGSQPLSMSVTEAETIVRAGLARGEKRVSLHDHLQGPDLTRFGEVISTAQPSPYGRAIAVVSEGSTDYVLLRRIFVELPDQRHRFTILRRDDCPQDILLAAVDEPGGRRALLDRKAGIPADIVDSLFTKIALSSTAQESRGTMFRAAVHPAVPLPLLDGILEKALAERDSRASLIAESANLDDERRRVIRTAVLRKTHRGKVQDAVMAELLGPDGVQNREIINWLHTLTDRPARERALRWIDESAASAGGAGQDDSAAAITSG